MLEIFGAVFGLLTTTERAVAVDWLPAASRATALSVCVPFAIVVVFHVTLYGAPVSSAPRLAPSSLNCTPATPRSEERRVGKECSSPWTRELLTEEESETVGGAGVPGDGAPTLSR